MSERKAFVYIVLVTGGRDYADRAHVFSTLDNIRTYKPGMCVVQGNARGADAHAVAWCKKNGVPCFSCDAHWDYYGNRAGGLRNGWMLDYMDVDVCVAFPGGTGTANMVRKANEAGIQIYHA